MGRIRNKNFVLLNTAVTINLFLFSRMVKGGLIIEKILKFEGIGEH